MAEAAVANSSRLRRWPATRMAQSAVWTSSVQEPLAWLGGSGQNAPGGRHVAPHLGDQHADVREALLPAQPCDEAQPQRFAVEVAVEVEQVSLDGGLPVVEAGADADVDHGRIAASRPRHAQHA